MAVKQDHGGSTRIHENLRNEKTQELRGRSILFLKMFFKTVCLGAHGRYAQKLLSDLFSNYTSALRPVEDTDHIINVTLQITLSQIIDMDERNQILTTYLWNRQMWTDAYLSWRKEDYDGLDTIRIPSRLVWKPDIVLYNSANDQFSSSMETNVVLRNDGHVMWDQPAITKSSCSVDVAFFPFDLQQCRLTFGSWTHNGNQMDLVNALDSADLADFVPNVEWEVLGMPSKKNVILYGCCSDPYPDITYTLHLKRRSSFYIFNLLIPCMMISFLAPLGFYLPADSGEKVSLGVTVLLALTVFQLLVAESMPPSESVPLIVSSRSSAHSGGTGSEDNSMGAIIRMALARLQLDVPQVQPAPASAFFRRGPAPATFTVPPSEEYLRELHACWRDTRALSHATSDGRTLAAMQDAAKFGLARMPAVELAIAALVVSPEEALRPDARCPRPQCRVTDDLLAKAYDAAARMGRIGNSLSHLMLALSASLQEATVDASVHSFGDASLQAFALMSRELGRLMSTLVQARRQVWLAHTCSFGFGHCRARPAADKVFRHRPGYHTERQGAFDPDAVCEQVAAVCHRGEDPVHCAIPKVLEFLQSLLEGGRSPATLRVYVAAISSRHARVDGNTVGCHRLVSLFLKGALRLRPPQAQRAPVWDLPLVLDALCLPPFEPLAQAELKWETAKTAFLLAITSGRRVGELHALSVSESCLRWNSDGSGVTLWPNAAFLPKVLSPSNLNRPIHLAQFTPPAGEEKSGLLCPVRALRVYVSLTTSMRRSEQLFLCYGGPKKGCALSKQRLSHWVVDAITQAYRHSGRPLPSGVRCHSTRAVATSWAALRGVPLQDICDAGIVGITDYLLQVLPGKYYIATMTMITASTALTIFIMNIHHCGPEARPIPEWARRFILDYLARICFVYEVGDNCLDRGRCKKQPALEEEPMALEEEEGSVGRGANWDVNGQPHPKEGVDYATQADRNEDLFVNIEHSEEDGAMGGGSRVTCEELGVGSYPGTEKVVERGGEGAGVGEMRRRREGMCQLQGLCRDVELIASCYQDQRSTQRLVGEWRKVAKVMDRFFMWLFFIMVFFMSLLIMGKAV
ncbi:Neuronal acetylcholine receptor subunit alpha-10 [Merluccius polli]|uniref:Neuronal acetylcholine receptor subunit alpha-10 n=1 Tax=Merluccius polli TaxID=89951 RepID=A0AA47M6P6_MERPO|nr:Neuronal acetylcholine receptor subunit alpha-10 [Merluccius polli]